MPARKTQVFFGTAGGVGWSEHYYWSGVVDIAALKPLLDQFVMQRVALLCSNCRLLWIRMAGSFARDPLIFDYESSNFSAGGRPETYNEASDALLIRSEAAAVGFNRVFWHGVPDNLIVNGVFNADGQWAQDFNAIRNNFKQSGNWQVVANVDNPQQPVNVVSAKMNTPRGIAILVENGKTLPFPGSVRIKGASAIGYNGVKRIVMDKTAAAPTRYILGGAKPQEDNDPLDSVTATPLVPKAGNVDEFFPERITSHRTGRPFGVRPGRKQSVLPLRR